MVQAVYFLISFVSIILAIAVHEFSHAFAANQLGDPTARSQGRLTLNPLAHIDLFGTVLLPLMLIVITQGSFAYGWGKATPFDPYNLRNPRKDTAIISIAGPLSNLILATLVAVVGKILIPAYYFPILVPFVIINVSLAVFNLIPVGPLDGQKILVGVLPRDIAWEYAKTMDKYGTLILLFLILPILTPVAPINTLISPIIQSISSFLLQ